MKYKPTPNRDRQILLKVAVSAIIGLIMVGGYIFFLNESERQTELDVVDLSHCKVIGNAADRKKYGTIIRNIYKCEDGMMYIR